MEIYFILGLILICIAEGAFILYLDSQIEQRNNFIKRVQREMSLTQRELQLLRTSIIMERHATPRIPPK